MAATQQTLIAGLLALGCTEVPCKSRKYRQFTRPTEPESYYFVGRNGALRVGRCVSDTVALGDGAKARICQVADRKETS